MSLAGLFVLQMGLGLAVGLLCARGAVMLINRLQLEYDGLYPATFPVVAGIPNAQTIFDVVFFVVLTSVLVQGTTIPIVARRLGLATGRLPAGTYTFDAVITGDAGHNLREVIVGPSAPAIGSPS